MDHANLWQAGGVPALRTPWNLVMLIPSNVSCFFLPVFDWKRVARFMLKILQLFDRFFVHGRANRVRFRSEARQFGILWDIFGRMEKNGSNKKGTRRLEIAFFFSFYSRSNRYFNTLKFSRNYLDWKLYIRLKIQSEIILCILCIIYHTYYFQLEW